MPVSYHEIHIKIADEEARSLLIAEMENIGFESFVESDDELVGYILSDQYDRDSLRKVMGGLSAEGDLLEVIQEERNWNEEWEKNYPPVTIGRKCHIRAPFHPVDENVPYDIIIEPKMSFGTAHHETTALMIEWLLETDMNGKRVLDMGCGTGVLAILANKMGAASVMAVDNDIWAYRNAVDNVLLNSAGRCQVVQGDAATIAGMEFDAVLANINRNILLEDIPAYRQSLAQGGLLFLSGFYEQDIPFISSLAEKMGLKLHGIKTKSNWVALCYQNSI